MYKLVLTVVINSRAFTKMFDVNDLSSLPEFIPKVVVEMHEEYLKGVAPKYVSMIKVTSVSHSILPIS